MRAMPRRPVLLALLATLLLAGATLGVFAPPKSPRAVLGPIPVLEHRRTHRARADNPHPDRAACLIARSSDDRSTCLEASVRRTKARDSSADFR